MIENMNNKELKDMYDTFTWAAKDYALGTPEQLEAATTAFLIGQELVRRGAL